MSLFRQKAQELICPRHLKKVMYLSVENNCPQAERVQCQTCRTPKTSLSIAEVDHIIQEFTQENIVIGIMGSLREELKNLTSQITRVLAMVAQEIETNIQSLNTNELSSEIAKWYEGKEIRLLDLQKLGELVSLNLVKAGDVFKLKQPTVRETQQKPIKDKLGQLAQVLELLATLLPRKVEPEILAKQAPLDFQWIHNVEEPKKQMNAAALNCSGNMLAIGMDGSEHNLQVWELSKHATVVSKCSLVGHTNNVQTVCFSSKLDILFSGSSDSRILVWAYQDEWHQVDKLEGHTWVVWSVFLHPHEDCLVSGSADKTVRVWGINEDNKFSCSQILKKHTHTVLCVRFNQEGSLLASGGWDKQIILYRQQLQEWVPMQTLIDHSDRVSALLFIDNTLISSGYDKKMRVWKQVKDSFKCIQVSQADVKSITATQTQQVLATGGRENSIVLWQQVNDETWKQYQSLNCGHELNQIIFDIQARLIYGLTNNIVYVYALKEYFKP